jgi:hypothetical protein
LNYARRDPHGKLIPGLADLAAGAPPSERGAGLIEKGAS